jgi:hypothetical protein
MILVLVWGGLVSLVILSFWWIKKRDQQRPRQSEAGVIPDRRITKEEEGQT